MTHTIRLAAVEDAEQILRIYTPYVTHSPASFELTPPGLPEMEARMAANLKTHPWLVCELGAEPIGYAYASAHRARAAYCWSVDVSVYIDSAHHRKGVARALYTSLFECLRIQGFYNAYAGITLPNQASQGLHESLGFKLVGIYEQVGFKFGKWHDVGWWQFELQPRAQSPSAPLLMPEAVRLPGWEQALATS